MASEGPSGLMHGRAVNTRPPKEIPGGPEMPDESALAATTPAVTPAPINRAVPAPLLELLDCEVVVAVLVDDCAKPIDGRRSVASSADVRSVRIYTV